MFDPFESNFIVRYAYCDLHGRMSLANLLKETQQISMEQCDHLGVGLDYLLPRNLAFLLIKQHILVNQMPFGGQRVRLVTTPTVYGYLYQRINCLYDEQGQELARVDARWVLVNTQTGQIYRRPPADMEKLFHVGQKAADFRIHEPENMRHLQTMKARQSMTDINRHINNASYLDIICDSIEDELTEGRQIQEAQIIYNSQILYGKEFDVYTAQQGDLRFVSGRSQDTLHFQSVLTLK